MMRTDRSSARTMDPSLRSRMTWSDCIATRSPAEETTFSCRDWFGETWRKYSSLLKMTSEGSSVTYVVVLHRYGALPRRKLRSHAEVGSENPGGNILPF